MYRSTRSILLVALFLGCFARSSLAVQCYVSDISKTTTTSATSVNIKGTTTMSLLAWCYSVDVDILVQPSNPKATLKGKFVAGLADSPCNATRIETMLRDSLVSGMGTTAKLNSATGAVCCNTDLCNVGSNLDLAVGAVAHTASVLAVLLAAVLAMMVARM